MKLSHFYLLVILVSFCTGVYRFKAIDKAGKILCILLIVTLITECLSQYMASKYHNNMPVYCIFNPVELLLLSLYFNYSVEIFRRYGIGIIIGCTGIAIGVINAIFFQPINTINSYFLLFEGFSVICMCLFALFQLLLHYDSLRLHKYVHFWFIVILLFFWSSTFLNWGLYDYFTIKLKDNKRIIDISILVVNVIAYGAIGLVFYMFPKMKYKDAK